MNDKELINNLIDIYTNLQRIKNAENKDKEIENQIKVVKSKLESMGIATTELTIE